ncbi:DNA repair protein [Dictyocaulus viviparus]|uniref:DNA repair protein n=1 Tax=Dictyocaulus viviparus TaxID=29172 RepID=A0A0D8XPG7_DICVI|nr:DNA repair protein [Dictyocaulus viviparus]
MSKRRFESSSDDKIPVVEKLYRQNQPSFHAAGGFMEDDDEYQQKREEIFEKKQKKADAKFADYEAPDNCIKCNLPMFDSWLWERYNHPVCDSCRDDSGEHRLIPRTEVKSAYLLKDCDLDLRKPPLRYWAKKNPHNPRYGDMKLYLKCQVIQRVLDVFGSWERFESEKVLRSSLKETRAEKNFEKKVKEMRQHIRGLGQVKIKEHATHEHVYGEETYDSTKDEYSKECIHCSYVLKYEKM